MYAERTSALTVKYWEGFIAILKRKNTNTLKIKDFFVDPSEKGGHRVNGRKTKTKRKS